ncbi:hypothetical protein [uncultured Methanobrevibacter sp.]|uniref:hypothetical protein n=1 Tax=uncultured Methanobrevibacter sp. TaxID=253161 RepID=UPI002601851B|nr:hypothetical protein [uncultured Methanobrevibacter sp.]
MDRKIFWLIVLVAVILQYINLKYLLGILSGYGILSLIMIFYPVILLVILIIVMKPVTRTKNFGFFSLTYTIFGSFPKKSTTREIYVPAVNRTITFNYNQTEHKISNTVNVNRGNVPIYETYNVGTAILEILYTELDESISELEKSHITIYLRKNFLDVPYGKGFYRKSDYTKSVSNFSDGELKTSGNKVVVYKTNHKDLEAEIVFN